MEKSNIPEIIDNLIIIPDTNILLYLYKCSFNSSQNIVELLNKVKDKIVVPYRVYEEYMAHKDGEQAKTDKKYDSFTKDLKSQVKDVNGKMSGSISESRKYGFPNCDQLEIRIKSYLEKISEAISDYETSLSSEKQQKSVQIANVEQLIQLWKTDDKILEKPDILQVMKYVKEGEFRYRYKMPPGYMDEEEKDKQVKKDSSKDNFAGRIRKYGDLFVWKAILKIGSESNPETTILFLTNDVKEDWWVLKGEANNKEPVRMRDELLEEFFAETGNNKIEFMTLSKFYELFSDYYEICDIKTRLELDYNSYIQGLVNSKFKEQIEDELWEKISEVEWEDIDSDFLFIQTPEVDFDEMKIDKIILNYDDDGETAIYDVELSVSTFPIHISKTEYEGSLWIADVELELKLSFQVQRDLRNLDEDGISFRGFSYNVISNRGAWEVYLERESEARAEADDAIENYYNH